MRKLIVLLLLLALAAGVVYLVVYPPDWLRELMQQAKQQTQEGLEQAARESKGFVPAKAPEDAVKKFREAVKERDYKTAAVYATSDYAEQLRKAGPAAQALGKSIDALREEMDRQNVQSDRSRALLFLIEPFPKAIRFEVKEKQDGKATAAIEDEEKPPAVGMEDLKSVDPVMIQALKQGLPPTVEIKAEGEGDGRVWRIAFPVSEKLRKAVDRLEARYEEYVRGLDQLRDEIKKGGLSKAEVERRLRTELEKLKQ
jgi:hypothetical protein